MILNRLLRKIATGTEIHCEVQNEPALRAVDLMPGVRSFKVLHNGRKVEIKRNQNPDATINPLYAKVSRPCPPFCIQPIQLAKNVETIGELELFTLLKKAVDDDAIRIVDSRITEWALKGTIPGAINVPWTTLTRKQGATISGILNILKTRFNVGLNPHLSQAEITHSFLEKRLDNILDFSEARTLVLFCNGVWCAQTPESVATLLSYGYPAEKLKYYRDGMQGWESLGLTTVVDCIDSCNQQSPACADWNTSRASRRTMQNVSC